MMRGTAFWTLAFALIFGIFTSASIAMTTRELEGRIVLPSQEEGQRTRPTSIDTSPSLYNELEILLNGGEYTALVHKDGLFRFPSVAPGRYSLQVISATHLFSEYKLDVPEEGNIRALEFKYPGASKAIAEYPLKITPHIKVDYFEKREKFSIFQLLKNPSFLAVVVPVLGMWLLPKLSESMMDPEEYKKVQEEMSNQDPQAMLSKLFSGGANTNSNDEDDD